MSLSKGEGEDVSIECNVAYSVSGPCVKRTESNGDTRHHAVITT